MAKSNAITRLSLVSANTNLRPPNLKPTRTNLHSIQGGKQPLVSYGNLKTRFQLVLAPNDKLTLIDV